MNSLVLCPLDGRYVEKVAALTHVMGERALAANRVRAEVWWLTILAGLKLPQLKKLTTAEQKILADVCALSEADLEILQKLENSGYKNIPATRHDVKAVEYFLRLKLQNTPLKDRLNWLHFALTSEDVNSVSYALMLADGVEKVLLPALKNLHKNLDRLSRREARSVLLARTHGQPAVPTTFGKEIRVFASRLNRQIRQLEKQQISFKFGGAVGNYNAHAATFPQINWLKVAAQFTDALNKGRKTKLFLSPVSTQIDNRDSYAELFDNLRRINIILLGLAQDMWRYISAGLVKQKTVAGEVGSSTMPQKVNPIDFENAEGNLQLANTLFTFFAEKLPLSRLQRDLSDSTVLRNMGLAFGYSLVAYTSLEKGLTKIAFDRAAACEELEQHPEVLAEAVQTILRANGCDHAYELLRDFTRGQKITGFLLADFIDGLSVPASVKMQLHLLEVQNYVGYATKLAEGKND